MPIESRQMYGGRGIWEILFTGCISLVKKLTVLYDPEIASFI